MFDAQLAQLKEIENKEEDEDTLFGLTIAAKMRRLHPIAKATAQIKFMEILRDLEFGV